MKKITEKTMWILDDLDGYGSDVPTCCDTEEKERLISSGWEDTFHEASNDEIARYGYYDSNLGELGIPICAETIWIEEDKKMKIERNEKKMEAIKASIIGEALNVGTQQFQWISGVGTIRIKINPISVSIINDALDRDDEYIMIGNFNGTCYVQNAIEVIYDLIESYRNNPGAEAYDVKFSISKSYRFAKVNQAAPAE